MFLRLIHRGFHNNNVTSHTKTYTNGFPFSNGNPFTSRFSPVQKKFASVRTAWAIRLKRKSSRSNGCVIRSQKLPIVNIQPGHLGFKHSALLLLLLLLLDYYYLRDC